MIFSRMAQFDEFAEWYLDSAESGAVQLGGDRGLTAVRLNTNNRLVRLIESIDDGDLVDRLVDNSGSAAEYVSDISSPEIRATVVATVIQKRRLRVEAKNFLKVLDDAVAPRVEIDRSQRGLLTLLSDPCLMKRGDIDLVAYDLFRSERALERAVSNAILSFSKESYPSSPPQVIAQAAKAVFAQCDEAMRRLERNLYRAEIETLELKSRTVKPTIEPKSVPDVPALKINGDSALQASYAALQADYRVLQECNVSLREANGALEKDKSRLEAQVAQLALRAEQKVIIQPVTVRQMGELFDHFRGSEVVTVGGYKSSPMGRTENYFETLRTLGASLVSFDAEAKPAAVMAKAKMAKNVILFSYAASHKLTHVLKSAKVDYLQVPDNTFNEIGFARSLYDFFVKK